MKFCPKLAGLYIVAALARRWKAGSQFFRTLASAATNSLVSACLHSGECSYNLFGFGYVGFGCIP